MSLNGRIGDMGGDSVRSDDDEGSSPVRLIPFMETTKETTQGGDNCRGRLYLVRSVSRR